MKMNNCQRNMSSKYKKPTNLTKTKNKTIHKHKHNVLLVLLLLLLLGMLPPRPPSSPPGQYRCDLLPNMAHGRRPLHRAHHLLTQMFISIGNNATNHLIGIRRASCLVLLSLLCTDLLLISWPRKISWK